MTPNQNAARIVNHLSEAFIPTAEGCYRMVLFQEQATGHEHVAMVMGDVARAEAPLVRMHSECMTGDLFGSRRCDCGDQLTDARTRIGQQGEGVILYLRQEGRGIGLANKLRAYALQDQGLDTVEANLRLGFSADQRNFDVAAAMLTYLGVGIVRLMTNNPLKIDALEACGLTVVERVPLLAQVYPENHDYLATMEAKLGHLFEDVGGAQADVNRKAQKTT